MIYNVSPGRSLTVRGTLGADGTLIADQGTAFRPGAVITVAGTSSNLGAINLLGGSGSRSTGATLFAAGTLTSVGSIDVAGGNYSTHAALLDVTGVLMNAGALIGSAGNMGAGAQLEVGKGGYLGQTGILTLQAAMASGDQGSTLTDAGLLVNFGQLSVDGGFLTNAQHTGATLDVTGTLENNGDLTVLRASIYVCDLRLFSV